MRTFTTFLPVCLTHWLKDAVVRVVKAGMEGPVAPWLGKGAVQFERSGSNLLGRGSQVEVYSGVLSGSNKQVAIKVVRILPNMKSVDIAALEDTIKTVFFASDCRHVCQLFGVLRNPEEEELWYVPCL